MMTSQPPAKAALERKGWSQRAAARHLGVTFEHLNRVLNGHRESASLLRRVDALPDRKEVANV